jgi:hypothetical protein
VLQAKARLNYCFLFKITLLWQLRFISKSEKEPIFEYSKPIPPPGTQKKALFITGVLFHHEASFLAMPLCHPTSVGF